MGHAPLRVPKREFARDQSAGKNAARQWRSSVKAISVLASSKVIGLVGLESVN
jgi:hypothetical protein